MMGCVEYKIKAINKEKTINKLCQICKINRAYIKDNYLYISVSVKFEKKIDKIFYDSYIKVYSKNYKGVFSFLKNGFFRIGVITSVFVYLVVLIISNMFVFNIEVIGLSRVNKLDVLNILKNENAVGIVLKSTINTQKIQTELQKMENVSLVSCMILGNTIVVNIKEKVYNEEYENKDEFKPIISSYDATITEITVIQGTPLVKVGQTVKQGQNLVAPYVIDSSGNKLMVKPMADIKGDVYHFTITNIPDEYIEHVDTGKTCRVKQISIFNNLIYSEGSDCKYEYFRVEESKGYLTKNLILPITIKYMTFFEQKIVKHENYFNANKEKIIEQCSKKTRQLFNDYEIIKEEYFTLESKNGNNKVTYTIITNKSVI